MPPYEKKWPRLICVSSPITGSAVSTLEVAKASDQLGTILLLIIVCTFTYTNIFMYIAYCVDGRRLSWCPTAEATRLV